MDKPNLTDARMLQRLEPPTGRSTIVLDTDTYNEIDDQFALTYAVLAADRLDLQAVYAAPFHNNRSQGPGDGMERSYEEILRVLDRLGRKPEGLVHRGSDRWLGSPETPVRSPAAEDLVQRALAQPADQPLYVLAIGAITNVASAILLEPAIREKIVVVWLAGQPHYWRSAREFNLQQDVEASQLMFDCGVPLVHLPCTHVAELLRTTEAEMAAFFRGRGAIGDYLYEIYDEYMRKGPGVSKVIWDIIAVAWMLEPSWAPTDLVHAPLLTRDVTWSVNPGRHFMRVANWCNRDAVFGDLINRLPQ